MMSVCEEDKSLSEQDGSYVAQEMSAGKEHLFEMLRILGM